MRTTVTKARSFWRLPVAAALLFFAQQQAAHADLWAFVDPRGVTHFAAEQIDANYSLFFKGDQFDSTVNQATESTDVEHPDYAISPSGARKLALIDISPGYKRVRTHIRGAAATHGIEYELLQAVIATESGFDSLAVSPRGAVGLMQLMPMTASRFGVAADKKRSVAQKLEDPATNIAAGASYLRYVLKLFDGRMELALAAYNAGEGAVQRAGNRIPAYRETQNYVKSVLGLYAMLKPPEPVRTHRAITGRIRMELPAGNLPVEQATPETGAAERFSPTSQFNNASGTAQKQAATRAQQDLSANE